jgi:peptidoglycan/xylan/chitin deacetylase (PgdA/CDA1 family)
MGTVARPETEAPRAMPLVPREQTRVTVLLYHMFGSMDSSFAVDPAAFEEQLAWLEDHHVALISAADLFRFLDGEQRLPARAAVITIDDGHKSTYTRAFPILKKHRAPFVLALNTGAIEGGRPEAVKWPEVREMLASGLCEIESHSHIHGHMDRLTIETNRREAEVSREILAARTGVRPEAFVFPFGGHDERARRVIAAAGYRAAFAASGSAVRADSPRFALPRVGVLRETQIADFARMFKG